MCVEDWQARQLLSGWYTLECLTCLTTQTPNRTTRSLKVLRQNFHTLYGEGRRGNKTLTDTVPLTPRLYYRTRTLVSLVSSTYRIVERYTLRHPAHSSQRIAQDVRVCSSRLWLRTAFLNSSLLHSLPLPTSFVFNKKKKTPNTQSTLYYYDKSKTRITINKMIRINNYTCHDIHQR
jgi:hypothetical protein